MAFDPRSKVLFESEYERISISEDYDTNPEQTHPVLLYVPDVRQHEHHHIRLSHDAAVQLFNWLGIYLGGK